jgi:hypothetical protein
MKQLLLRHLPHHNERTACSFRLEGLRHAMHTRARHTHARTHAHTPARTRPHNHTHAQAEYVEQLLSRLGLLHAADTLVGDPTKPKSPGISGGEQRRLALGLGLIGLETPRWVTLLIRIATLEVHSMCVCIYIAVLAPLGPFLSCCSEESPSCQASEAPSGDAWHRHWSSSELETPRWVTLPPCD